MLDFLAGLVSLAPCSILGGVLASGVCRAPKLPATAKAGRENGTNKIKDSRTWDRSSNHQDLAVRAHLKL